MTALALLTWPVAYTLRLGEVNLIVAALAGADLLRRHDGHWGQGIATGLAAGIKLTPLIFVAYLLITGRIRAAATAAATFAATVAVGIVLLPSPSKVFWLDGVFFDQNRIGDPANLSDQSLAGAVARLAGSLCSACRWWAIAALLVGLAGITVAAWAHWRGRRLAGVTCCAITGLLISPFSWTHHWVWAVPLLTALAVIAWRRRSAACGLAAAAAAAVYSRRIPLFGLAIRLDSSGCLKAIFMCSAAWRCWRARPWSSSGSTSRRPGGPLGRPERSPAVATNRQASHCRYLASPGRDRGLVAVIHPLARHRG